MFSTRRDSLGKISPEGLPLAQNPTGSVSALPVSPPAGTLRGGVAIFSRFYALKYSKHPKTARIMLLHTGFNSLLSCITIVNVLRPPEYSVV